MVEFLNKGNRYSLPFDIRNVRTHGFVQGSQNITVVQFNGFTNIFYWWPDGIDLIFPGFRQKCGFIIDCSIGILFDDMAPLTDDIWGVINNQFVFRPSHTAIDAPSDATVHMTTFDVFTPATEWRYGFKTSSKLPNNKAYISTYFTYIPYKEYIQSEKI